jgi:hypothetical protein
MLAPPARTRAPTTRFVADSVDALAAWDMAARATTVWQPTPGSGPGWRPWGPHAGAFVGGDPRSISHEDDRGDPWHPGEEPEEGYDVLCAPSDCATDVCPIEGASCCGAIPLVPDGHPWFMGFADDPHVNEAAVKFRLSGGTSDERKMVEYAWAVLYHNQDIVKWAACLLTDDPDAGDCIVDWLNNEHRDPLRITIDDEFGAFGECPGDGSGFLSWGDQITQQIKFCSSEPLWQNLACTWSSLGSPFVDWREQNCIGIYLSLVLAHELSHVCWRRVGWWHNDIGPLEHAPCDFARRIGNVVLWGLLERYRAKDAVSERCDPLFTTSRFCTDAMFPTIETESCA